MLTAGFTFCNRARLLRCATGRRGRVRFREPSGFAAAVADCRNICHRVVAACTRRRSCRAFVALHDAQCPEMGVLTPSPTTAVINGHYYSRQDYKLGLGALLCH